MMARGTTFDIDATFSNPAGLVWTHEGWQVSFNWQRPHQDRDIETTFPLFATPDHRQAFHGKASAPFVPGLFASWHKGRWAVGAMVGIVGSGGYVRYGTGLPMFTAPVMASLAAKGLTPDLYTIDASLKGKQYVYGAQVVAAYRVTDHLSAAVGLRANYYDGYYRGHVRVSPTEGAAAALGLPQQLVGLSLGTDQRGWGFNPILAADYRLGGLTLAARYEFRAKMSIPNKTHDLSVEVAGMTTEQATALMGDKVAAYRDGVKTRYDLPALFVLAAGYEFRPGLRATLEYHFFDDRHAHMQGERQKQLTHGTREYLGGVEWDINKTFTVSAGAQRTDYGLSDEFQQNTSFSCDSWSVGFGGAVNITPKLRVNASYFWTMYDDYTKSTPAGSPGYAGTTLAGSDTYSRTNRVFGLGIDWRF
ncbi:MAG: hypothetical protein J6M53_09500 [Bacteroidaceae bacterium]|nr:hypothetical protein [Bacteroidaceae bacterium]